MICTQERTISIHFGEVKARIQFAILPLRKISVTFTTKVLFDSEKLSNKPEFRDDPLGLISLIFNLNNAWIHNTGVYQTRSPSLSVKMHALAGILVEAGCPGQSHCSCQNHWFRVPLSGVCRR